MALAVHGALERLRRAIGSGVTLCVKPFFLCGTKVYGTARAPYLLFHGCQSSLSSTETLAYLPSSPPLTSRRQGTEAQLFFLAQGTFAISNHVAAKHGQFTTVGAGWFTESFGWTCKHCNFGKLSGRRPAGAAEQPGSRVPVDGQTERSKAQLAPKDVEDLIEQQVNTEGASEQHPELQCVKSALGHEQQGKPSKRSSRLHHRGKSHSVPKSRKRLVTSCQKQEGSWPESGPWTNPLTERKKHRKRASLGRNERAAGNVTALLLVFWRRQSSASANEEQTHFSQRVPELPWI